MKNKLMKTGFFAAIACAALITSCQKEDLKPLSSNATPAVEREADVRAKGVIEIRLGDVFNGGMNEMHLDIARVAVHYANSTDAFGGWVYLPFQQHVLEVLQYQEGRSTLLARNASMPDGVIDQVRLEFGDKNSVFWIDKNGKHSVPLTLTKEDHTGDAKVNINMTQKSKFRVTINLNARQSVTEMFGGQTMAFHPHLKLARVIHEGLNGAPSEEQMPDVK
jgi:hypothetical protein